MNKYKKQILLKLFGISFIISVFSSIAGMFLFIPYLISLITGLLYIKYNTKNKDDNIRINKVIENDIKTYNKTFYPIKYNNKVKIKKRTRF